MDVSGLVSAGLDSFMYRMLATKHVFWIEKAMQEVHRLKVWLDIFLINIYLFLQIFALWCVTDPHQLSDFFAKGRWTIWVLDAMKTFSFIGCDSVDKNVSWLFIIQKKKKEIKIVTAV